MYTFDNINVAIDLLGAAISLIIFFFLIAGSNRKIKLNRYFAYVVICSIAIMLLDATSWSLDGKPGTSNAIITRMVSFFGYLFMFLVIGAFSLYLTAFIKTKTHISKSCMRIPLIICAVSVLTVIISLFNNMYYYIDQSNLYHRGDWYWLSQVLVFIGLIVNTVIVVFYQKALTRIEFFSFLTYLILPIFLNIFHIWVYAFSWSCVALTLAVVIIYAGIQSNQAKLLAEQELEITQSRMAIVLSQIQPHFLYNTLAAIQDLCVQDPEQAEHTVQDFSIYLRGNLDALSLKVPIPFKQELRHVKLYLSLEKKRFRDRLQYDFDIKADDFSLPSLSLQPIVENAVHHGIMQHIDGGHIIVRSLEDAEYWYVIVIDNGGGFDLSAPLTDDRSHIGISNVRYRIETICGGSLDITSSPEGTTATISIPKEI